MVHCAVVFLVQLGVGSARAQDATTDPPATEEAGPGDAVVRPPAGPAPGPGDVRVAMDFAPETSIYDLALFFAQVRGVNLVIGNADELRERKVTILAVEPVTVDVAWATFLEALATAGFRVDHNGTTSTIVKVTTGMPEVAPTLRSPR